MLDIQFSKPVQDSSLTLSQISISGPSGPITPSPTALSPVGSTPTGDYHLNLAGLTGLGTYNLSVGPNILGADDGLPMDQDHDGSPGQADDAYQAVLFSSSVAIAASNTSDDGKALVVDGTTAAIDGTHAFASVEVVGGGTLNITDLTGNLGRATLSGTGSRLSLDGSYTIDQGLAAGAGQTLTLGGTWTNAAGSTISASGATLNLAGNWSNAGAIVATGTTVNLGGSFTLAGLGNFSRTGGAVNLTGTLDNAGTTLALDDGTGSWALAGGTISGGTVSTSGGGTLSGVTLQGALDLTTRSGVSVTVSNGLTLAGGTVSVGDAAGANWAGLLFSGSQALGGTGAVVFGGSTLNTLGLTTPASTLTVGPGITIRGKAGTLGYPGGYTQADASFVNQGTVSADVAGGTLTLNGKSWANQGTIAADVAGTAITVLGQSFTNLGTATALNGGILNLNTSLTLRDGGSLGGPQAGTITVSGNLLGDTHNANAFHPLATIQLNGTGTPTAPQYLEAMSQDLGNTPTAFVNNFAYGTLSLANNTYVKLIDQERNAPGSGPEAVYVNTLVVAAGTTLDLNGLHLYARVAEVAGVITGGSATSLYHSGALAYDQTWDNTKPHVVTGGVIVPSGVTSPSTRGRSSSSPRARGSWFKRADG